MPPAGGFPQIKYKRNLPFRGPSGVVILGSVTAVCAYGFYRVGLGNLEKRYVFDFRNGCWTMCVRRGEET
jgi:NADH dehydrogenase (ubiquinone) 1 alpha subcomplex subunit 13